MDPKLSIKGLFGSEQELLDAIIKRKICYDSEPYCINKKGQILQIGFQINLYATFSDGAEYASPDPEETLV